MAECKRLAETDVILLPLAAKGGTCGGLLFGSAAWQSVDNHSMSPLLM